MVTPYEPPPDYPMVDEPWGRTSDSSSTATCRVTIEVPPSAPSSTSDSSSSNSRNSISWAESRSPEPTRQRQKENKRSDCRLSHSASANHHLRRPLRNYSELPSRHSSVERDRYLRYPGDQYYDPFFAARAEMLRTRQFPEVAGIYGCDEQPALRRFTKYNQSMMGREIIGREMHREAREMMTSPPQSTVFSKSTKKPSFFTGNWTFRERKQTRPSIVETKIRDDRPLSMNLSDIRSTRSRSETATRAATHDPPTATRIDVASRSSDVVEFPRNSEFRVPVRLERGSMIKKTRPVTSSISTSSTEGEYKTNITVDDVAVLRPKKDIETNNNRIGFLNCAQMRKSCPDLDTSISQISNLEQHRVSKKRNRRHREKAGQAAWKKKLVQDWSLDDVLLWLQSCQLDDVASLLIGYDLRGEDLLQWDHHTLSQLGVGEETVRAKILDELANVIKNGPAEDEKSHKTLFDIVRLTSYDQVLAVETPLTTRDISVTHGRLGCLQITKVNGANLPLREHDCLLEINERPGEQFKSALMLTKLISDCNGTPIRFVVLRRKSHEITEECPNERSSSGISSSPQTPTE